MMVFPEEQQLLETLLEEWYDAICEFTSQCDGIFGERGKHLDKQSPPWMRHDFPEGYSHEIGKKVGRIKQFLECDPIPWDKVLDELRDINNYSRMMGSIILMLERRKTWDQEQPSEPFFSSPPSQESPPGMDQDSTTAPSPAPAAPSRKPP